MRESHSLRIRDFIYSQPLNKMFGSRQLVRFGYRGIVDNITSLLVKMGELIRVGWGVFMRKGSTRPSDKQVADFKAGLFGRRAGTHGSTTAEEFDLPARQPINRSDDEYDEEIARPAICITSGTSSFRILTRETPRRKNMFSVCDRKLFLGDQNEGLLIRSLWQMGKKQFQSVPNQTIKELPYFDALELIEHAAWMPAWISDRLHEIIEEDEKEKEEFQLLPIF